MAHPFELHREDNDAFLDLRFSTIECAARTVRFLASEPHRAKPGEDPLYLQEWLCIPVEAYIRNAMNGLR